MIIQTMTSAGNGVHAVNSLWVENPPLGTGHSVSEKQGGCNSETPGGD